MHGSQDIDRMFVDLFWGRYQYEGPMGIGILLAIWVLGYVSRWIIRRQPDSDHKPTMLHGTWLVPTLLTALLALVVGTQYIGAAYTDYPISLMSAPVFTMALAGAFIGWILPDWVVAGYLTVFHLIGARLRHEKLNQEDIVEAWRGRRKSRAYRIGFPFVWLFLVGVPVYTLTQYTIPADQMLAGTRQLSRLGERVTDRLQNPLVTVVVVGGPPIVDERKVIIGVKKESSEQQIEEVRDQARQVMRELDPEHVWEILVAREREDDHRSSRSPPHPRN